MRLVVVTKDPSHESPARLRELAPPGVRVVMSSAAWVDYDVPASPYFVHVDARGELAGEGTAQRFDQVLSLLADAVSRRRRRRPARVAGAGAARRARARGGRHRPGSPEPVTDGAPRGNGAG